jgi:1-acyl-sn-glycerol-3-phosphate acyltransferase
VGIALQGRGPAPLTGGALMVANHISWLDITALHAVCRRRASSRRPDVKALAVAVSPGRRLEHAVPRAANGKRDALRVVHQMAGALRTAIWSRCFGRHDVG